jgi:DNA recombination protein RmuC
MLLSTAAGALAGGVAGWLLRAGRAKGAEARAARVPELEARLAEREQALLEARTGLAQTEARLEAEQRAAAEKLALLEEARGKLADAFKALSDEALKSNNRAFLDLARTALERFQEGARNDLEARRQAVAELVGPLREALARFDGRVGELEQARVAAYSALHQELRGLVETHLPALHRETANLVKALRQPTARGRWGEIQLRRVVELAGMLDHCDFVEQESRTTEEGRFRPDLVVRLPGGKQLVVDAKAPIESYLRALETEDDETRHGFLADHARQVRDHIRALGSKAYWEQFEPAPEFAVLFLPGEVFFSAALQQDPGLIEAGVKERVILATPTTLIALLRAVYYGWRQEALAQNARQIAAMGKQLFERVATLADRWTKLGTRLDRVVRTYNEATAALESRVLVSARRLGELEAGPAGVEIAPLRPVDRTARALQAADLTGSPGPSLCDHPRARRRRRPRRGGIGFGAPTTEWDPGEPAGEGGGP